MVRLGILVTAYATGAMALGAGTPAAQSYGLLQPALAHRAARAVTIASIPAAAAPEVAIAAGHPAGAASIPGATPTSTPVASGFQTGLTVGTVAWGGYIPGAPASMAPFAPVEAATGKRAALVNWYEHWGGQWSAFNGADYARVLAHGSTPLITWMSDDPTAGGLSAQGAYTDAAIASGAHDAYIKSWADGMRTVKGTVFLRLDHEMNGNWYAWSPGINGNTPAGYIAMWRHVHAIFVAEGATNVRWVWSPNVDFSQSTVFAQSYPGDAYVDWVALDGYNWGTSDRWHSWQTFTQVFAQSYREMLALTSRPLMIAEVSSVEGAPGAKASWITSALTTELTDFPAIRALLWFDEPLNPQDYRWNSTQPSWAAYTAAIGGYRRFVSQIH